eukprot:6205982-Pleurochrysis_carterae.AAC.3
MSACLSVACASTHVRTRVLAFKSTQEHGMARSLLSRSMPLRARLGHMRCTQCIRMVPGGSFAGETLTSQRPVLRTSTVGEGCRSLTTCATGTFMKNGKEGRE